MCDCHVGLRAGWAGAGSIRHSGWDPFNKLPCLLSAELARQSHIQWHPLDDKNDKTPQTVSDLLESENGLSLLRGTSEVGTSPPVPLAGLEGDVAPLHVACGMFIAVSALVAYL